MVRIKSKFINMALFYLNLGTYHLGLTEGFPCVRADADVSNTPMVSAFQRARYRQFAIRRKYRKHKLYEFV